MHVVQVRLVLQAAEEIRIDARVRSVRFGEAVAAGILSAHEVPREQGGDDVGRLSTDACESFCSRKAGAIG